MIFDNSRSDNVLYYMRIKSKCCLIRFLSQSAKSDPLLDAAASVASPGGGVAGCSPRCSVAAVR